MIQMTMEGSISVETSGTYPPVNMAGKLPNLMGFLLGKSWDSMGGVDQFDQWLG